MKLKLISILTEFDFYTMSQPVYCNNMCVLCVSEILLSDGLIYYVQCS